MKNLFLIFILFLFVTTTIYAQFDCVTPQKHLIKSNRIGAYVWNDGSLFHDDSDAGFYFPYVEQGPNISTIYSAALCIGGLDPGGNLKVAAASLYRGRSDFAPGPLDPETGLPYTDMPCEYFNKIWVVNKEEINAFLEDWNDNKKIDELHRSILLWPGNGNPYFGPEPLPSTTQGWAPFFDNNSDGIYNPMDGDFPAISPYNDLFYLFPDEITWTVFHDKEEHPVTGGYQMRMEVQQTTFVLDCDSQPEMENTVFVDYKFINRAFEDIDSFYVGIMVDFDLGCPDDNFLGSMPDRNTFYSYNGTPMDGDIFCISPLGEFANKPPVMSVKFMEWLGADLDKFIYFYRGGIQMPIPGTESPQDPQSFYNYLTGSWLYGTPLTFGGNGFDPLSTSFTDYAYSGNPNNPDEWTMLSSDPTFRNFIALGSTGFSNSYQNTEGGLIQPGKSLKMTVAFTCNSDPDHDHISIINQMQNDDLKNLQLDYYSLFGINGPYCQSYADVEPVGEEEEEFIAGIYPNPTSDFLTIAIKNTIIEEVEVYNTAWQLLYIDKTPKKEVQTIDLNNFAQGLYFLKLKLDGQTLVQKIIVN